MRRASSRTMMVVLTAAFVLACGGTETTSLPDAGGSDSGTEPDAGQDTSTPDGGPAGSQADGGSAASALDGGDTASQPDGGTATTMADGGATGSEPDGGNPTADGGRTGGTGEPEPGAQVGQNVQLKENVVTLTSPQIAAGTLLGDRLQLPLDGNEGLANLAPGTILVSQAGGGLLRKVVRVRQARAAGGRSLGDLLEIFTSPATLLEAVRNADFTIERSGIAADLNQAELVAGGGTASLSVLLTASLSISVKVTGSIRAGQFERMELELLVSENASATDRLRVMGGIAYSGSTNLLRTTSRFVEFIGPVPVFQSLTLSLDAGYQFDLAAAANIDIGLSCQGTMEKRLLYQAGSGWQNMPIVLTSNCWPEPAEFQVEGSVDARVFLRPRVDLKFYELAGPYLQAEIGLSVRGNICPNPATLSAQAYWLGTAGIDATALGMPTLFERELGAGELPIASVSAPFCTGTWNSNELFRECFGDTCKPCGGLGQSCCTGNSPCFLPFFGGDVETACGSDSTCQPCGGENQPCCGTAPNQQQCNSPTASGQGLRCATGLYATSTYLCKPCGQIGQRCCLNSSCDSPAPGDLRTLNCVSGTTWPICKGCGKSGQACCVSVPDPPAPEPPSWRVPWSCNPFDPANLLCTSGVCDPQ